MNEKIIETAGLTVYYGHHRGIVDVNLSVERGEVFGFLGPNGAGKTTTLRVLLDIIRPTKGQATIFGLDCQEQGTEIRKRVSYLPGELSLYPNMKGLAFLKMLANIHQYNLDETHLQELFERLDFDPSRKMKEYSRGNKQKVGLVAAFMGKPDLLILDEPTGGLDPLVQHAVLDLVRETKLDGRTVFFSSHILPEVEAVCDRVGIIRDGHLIKTDSVEVLTKQQFKRLNLTLRETPPQNTFVLFEGVKEIKRMGSRISLEITKNLDQVIETAIPFGIIDIETPPVTLEEIFLAFYGNKAVGDKND